MKRLIAFAAFALLTIPGAASAEDWGVNANVLLVEVSNMPNTITFQIDQPAGPCGAGSYLSWNVRGSDATERAHNSEAVLSMLMTAKTSGQKIRVFGLNNCTVNLMYLV